MDVYHIAVNSPLMDSFQEDEPFFDLYQVIEEHIEALKNELEELKIYAD